MKLCFNAVKGAKGLKDDGAGHSLVLHILISMQNEEFGIFENGDSYGNKENSSHLIM